MSVHLRCLQQSHTYAGSARETRTSSVRPKPPAYGPQACPARDLSDHAQCLYRQRYEQLTCAALYSLPAA